uniref:Lipase maturation factor n=1 Tax=Elaeophora elaphi TaxID=1147741 RepID=A0A158Q8Z8_9BILA
MKAKVVKDILLIGHSFIYLAALASLYWQIPGLYGEKGLIPVASKLSCNESSCQSYRNGVNILPVVINFFRIAPSYALQVIVLLGMAVASFSIMFNFARNTITYLFLFVVYSTAIQVGDVFLRFQWDSLLIESGAICILIAPLPFMGPSPADNISLYLMRWLVFRLMYASGVVKLTSHCPLWWDLAALDVHFESQCVPTWISYYIHMFPKWLKHLSTALTFYIEIILPPLFLLPFKYARYFSFGPQILLMGMIMATGNYNFFNLLISIECVAILVDSDEFRFSTKGMYPRFERSLTRLGTLISAVLIVSTICFFVYYFNIGIDGFKIVSSIAFTTQQFDEFVEESTIWLLYIGVIGFVAEVIAAVLRYFTEIHESKLHSLLHLVYIIITATFFFSISTVSFVVISNRAQVQIPTVVKHMHHYSESYELTHSYGLFRRMTGLHGRPEVILEGSYELNGSWIMFDFYSKPGKLNERPRFVLPHQPRLDWQMWFAALGTYHNNAFFLSLAYHLLRNNSEVTYLMKKYPFEEKLPNFIRADLYLYHYTKINLMDEWPKDYWRRDFQQKYMPSITREDTKLSDYLHQNGFVLKKQFTLKNQNFDLEKKLRTLHGLVRTLNPTAFVDSVILAHAVLFVAYIKFRKVTVIE